MTLGVLRESIQAETQIPKTSQHIYHNGRLVTDDAKTMEQLRIGDGEMLAMHVRHMHGSAVPTASQPVATPPPRQQQQPQGRGDDEAETLRLRILGDPSMRAQMESEMPQIAAALNDPQRFAQLLHDASDRDRRERAERQRQIAMLNEDPFDPEAQARIEEIIRQERVMENLQSAVEHNPEVFGRVHMLYVDVEVNGHKLKAFVDSGAQATIMSPSFAEACGIMRLVDKRFAGVARGVGTANILGRVHSAQIKIGNLFLPCSFTVMEGKAVDLLLGLDMLKRHQATIDLAKDQLIIQGVAIPFLGEAEIPKDSEDAYQQEPTVSGPGGTTIGARTGAVTGPESQAAGPSNASQPGPASVPATASAPTPTTSRGAPSQPPQPQAAASAPSFPESDIKTLTDLGFTREQAMSALQATDGNLDYAAGLLLG
ncbi:putative dna damage-inducible protein 1 protein [Zalerion maritima]|uniref:DNA damage-inducible protein 1 n=1 Tax=Zalerion maritima TaxID=339359 RepID=A0AAD5S115_9PEZI|nr:putative dna damage-inducible protein 1 protein [Zalerion maritima]